MLSPIRASSMGRSPARRRHARAIAWRLAMVATLVTVPPLLAAALEPRGLTLCRERPEDLARTAVKKLAYEAYPSWALAHPDRACPLTVDELLPWLNQNDDLDPWGRTIAITCDGRLLRARSRGPDGSWATADDVWSDR